MLLNGHNFLPQRKSCLAICGTYPWDSSPDRREGFLLLSHDALSLLPQLPGIIKIKNIE
jgi:hypothetical protein